jgi:hypothetical protein
VGAAYSHADMLKFDSLYVRDEVFVSAAANQAQEPLQFRVSPKNPAILDISTRTIRLGELPVAKDKQRQRAALQDVHELPVHHQR